MIRKAKVVPEVSTIERFYCTLQDPLTPRRVPFQMYDVVLKEASSIVLLHCEVEVSQLPREGRTCDKALLGPQLHSGIEWVPQVCGIILCVTLILSSVHISWLVILLDHYNKILVAKMNLLITL